MTRILTRRMMQRVGAIAALAGVLACGTATQATAQVPPPAGNRPALADTLDPNYIPIGFGTLRQDDVAIKVSPGSGLQVRAVPLDERILRLMSPDSYRSLREIVAGKQRQVDGVRERNGLQSYSLWYVSFYALEQGETRFSPSEFIISNVGRDFRPLDIFPLSPGFGEYRLKQREVQSALYVFDGALDVNQPLTAQLESVRSVTDWTAVLERVERERSLVRSRAASKNGKATPPPPSGTVSPVR